MMEILNLRACPEYLPVLAQWHHNEWLDLNPGQTLTQRIEKMQAYLDDNFIPSTFVAKDKTILGSASILANDMETRPQLSPWLASVFVAPEYRNRGVGTQLVLHVMAQAKNEGIKTLYLFTPDKTGFYKNLGWHTLSVMNYHGHEVSIMQTTLNND